MIFRPLLPDNRRQDNGRRLGARKPTGVLETTDVVLRPARLHPVYVAARTNARATIALDAAFCPVIHRPS